MAHSDILTHGQGNTRIRMADRAILNIAAGTDVYMLRIPANNHRKPDTDILFQCDIADHSRIGGDKVPLTSQLYFLAIQAVLHVVLPLQ